MICGLVLVDLKQGHCNRYECPVRLKYKYKYKLGIRNAYASFEDKLSDEMCYHFANKNPPEFRKTWLSSEEMSIRMLILMVIQITIILLKSFQSTLRKCITVLLITVCAVNNHFLRSREEQIANSDMLNHNVVNSITVELIDKCMRSMKKGKACGPDNLCMEHLVYAHPSLLLHLKLLFKLILKHGFVPDCFGFGISIPLIKDKSGNLKRLV